MNDARDDMTASPAAALTLTENAARRILKVLEAEPPGAMIRLSVNGGGCSGFQYDFGFDAERAPDDLVIEKNGATMLVDPVSMQFLEGSTVDFVDDLMGQAFRIVNPNATASCGCGTSFAV